MPTPNSPAPASKVVDHEFVQTEAAADRGDPQESNLQGVPNLTLGDLISSGGLTASTAVVVRHRPIERKLQAVLPWLVADRPDLFQVYQSFQERRAAACLMRRAHLISFLGLEPGRAVFAGAFQIGDATPVSEEIFQGTPGQAELFELGQSRSTVSSTITRFDLRLIPGWDRWVGRLVIDWPGKELSWFRLAEKNAFSITAITEENRFVQTMPDWPDLNLTWAQLQVLPRSWRARLAEWRGVYLIFDTDRSASYVGSAAGAENILGRWVSYGRTGHGGNVQLRSSRPESLRFSILQLTSPDLAIGDVIALESNWKARLHTREFGLNGN